MQRREQGWEQRCHQRAEEGDIVQHQRNRAPFSSKFKPHHLGEGPNHQTRRDRYQGSHQHIGAELRPDPLRRAQQRCRRIGPKPRHLRSDRANLQQAEQHKDHRQQNKTHCAAELRQYALRQAHQPARIELRGDAAGHINPARFRPGDLRGVEGLDLRRIRDHMRANPAESPGNQQRQAKQRHQRDQHGHQQRGNRGHALLQRALQRPNQRDDENRKHHRGDHRLRCGKRSGQDDHASEREQNDQGARQGAHFLSFGEAGC